MADTLLPGRSEAEEYARFVHQLYRDDPELVERCYEMIYFGTSCWRGSPSQRVEHSIDADAAGPPCSWMFLPDYSAARS